MTAKDRRTLALMTQAAIDWEQSYLDSLRGTDQQRERQARERLIAAYIALRAALEAASVKKAGSTEKRRRATLTSQARRRHSGKLVSGSVPFGYTKDASGYLSEAPQAQQAITAMREWRAAGVSFRKISARLKTEFHLTLSAYGVQRVVEHRRVFDTKRL